MKHIERDAPPRVAQWIIRGVVPDHSREFVFGDLNETFAEIVKTEGARAARRWYWRQAFRCAVSAPGAGTIAPAMSPAGSGSTIRRAFAAVIRDSVFAFRAATRTPAASAAAVLTLALGIGANVAIFSVAWPALVEPLPFPDEDRLARIDLVMTTAGRSYRNPISPGDYTDLRRATSFAKLAGFNRFTSEQNLIGRGDPEQVELAFVTDGFFDVLGISAVEGRPLDRRDLGQESRVIVLNERLWRRRFDADRSIVGRAISLDGTAYTVIGVVPSITGLGTRDADAWTLMQVDPVSRLPRRGYYLGMIGRLRDGVSIETANQELRMIMARAAAEFPDINQNISADAMPIREMLAGPVRQTLIVLLTAAGLVLVVAGINLSGLQIARHLIRGHEIEVRRALGASRARLIGQLVVESLALSTLGGAAGVLCAWMTLRGLASLQPQVTWFESAATPGTTVLVYAGAITLLTGLLVALGPAWHASRPRGFGLRGWQRTTAGRRTIQASGIVVATQVTLTIILLVGASLVGLSLVRVLTVNPGFEFDQGIAADLTLPAARYPNAQARGRFFNQLIERVETIPGVSRACTINNLPLDNPGYNMTFVADGDTRLVGSHPKTASPGCFEVLRIALLRGRLFNDVEPEPVAIVSSSMARQLWRDGSDPIGRVLRVGLPDGERLTVVGVVGDIRNASLESRFVQQVWLPPSLPYFPPQRLLVRSDLPPEEIATAARHVLRDLDPDLALARVRTMDEIVSRTTAPRRFVLVLLGSFAVVALVLCAVGIYGVLAQFVGQRTREIGIRMALGAHRRHVLRFVTARVGVAVGAGAVVGLAAAWILSQLITQLLFEVSARDRRVYVAVVAFVSFIAALAAWMPARRASRVNPAMVLRSE